MEHICQRNICTKANRTLGFHKRDLAACPKDVIESAYKGLVVFSWNVVVQFGRILLQDEFEKVQKRAVSSSLL